MAYRHVGIRPVYKTVMSLDKTKVNLRYEIMPEGGFRVWTKRMLKSGCGNRVELIKTLGDLLYCPTCGEYFSMDQFEEELDDE